MIAPLQLVPPPMFATIVFPRKTAGSVLRFTIALPFSGALAKIVESLNSTMPVGALTMLCPGKTWAVLPLIVELLIVASPAL